MNKKSAPPTEDRMYAVIQNALDAVVEMDSKGRITFWNPQAEKTFGWTRKEALGRLMSETIIPPKYRQAHTLGLRHFFETGEGPVFNKRLELSAIHKDGHEFPVELTVILLRTDGDPVFTAFLRDISEQKQIETQMIKANEELRRLNRLKTEFTSMVSHELRTPLNAIKQSLDNILDEVDGPATPEQRETLGIAKSNVDRLTRMLDNVLNYTSHEFGKLEMAFGEADLKALVAEVHAFMKPTAVRKTIALTLSLPTKPFMALCDADRIRELLINLVDNALKYTPLQGEIAVALQAAGDMVDLRVSDTGPGIKPENRERIFTLFSHGTGGTGTGGSGVGLAICKIIAENHGGNISVESAPGWGSQFTVRWPVRPQRTPDNR